MRGYLIVAGVAGTQAQGWGECVAGAEPLYSEEWAEGAWIVLRDFLIPEAASRPGGTSNVKGNRMAKATLEMALLDAKLRAEGRRVGVGVVCYVEGTGIGPYEGAKVSVRRTDGRTLVHEVRAALGSLERPMSDHALEDKARSLGAFGAPRCDIERVIAAVWQIDALPKAAELARLAS